MWYWRRDCLLEGPQQARFARLIAVQGIRSQGGVHHARHLLLFKAGQFGRGRDEGQFQPGARALIQAAGVLVCVTQLFFRVFYHLAQVADQAFLAARTLCGLVHGASLLQSIFIWQ